MYVINNDYIAVNNEKTKSIEMHTEDIDKCKVIKSNLETNFLSCQHTQPIIPLINFHCTTMLYLDPTNPGQKCKTLPTEPINTIVKLKNTNQWLYSVKQTTKLEVKCKNESKTIKITDEGLLTFLTACTIQTNEFTIIVAGYPIKVENKPEETEINETSEEKRQTNSEEKSDKKWNRVEELKLIDHRYHNQEFKEETNKLILLKKAAEDIENQKRINRRNETTNMTMTGTSILIIGIIMATVITKLIRKNKKKNKIIINHTTTNQCQKREETEVPTNKLRRGTRIV